MNTDNARMNTDKGLKGDATVTQAVIGAAYKVSNCLGAGFLEKVYENALALELRAANHVVDQQKPIDVWYRGQIVGCYQADLVVDEALVVELKAVAGLDRSHRAQCLNYLRATHIDTGLIINFGRSRLEVQRVLAGPHE